MKIIKTVLGILILGILINSCAKEYSIENNGLKLSVGTWEFADSTTHYSGNMDSAYITSTTPTKELHLVGTSAEGNQTFRMTLYADTFVVGSYKASLFQSTFNYTATAKTIYEADQLVGEFTVKITSISSNLVIGTFAGVAKDSTNKLKKLAGGAFKATLNNGIATQVSTGVLGDSSGNCKPVVINGIYTQGINTTAANTVQIQVVVAVAGNYTISTNTVGGLTFSGTGTFTKTGTQTVILNAAGIPELSGEQLFTVKYGNSQCAFKVNILPGVAPSGDYFPLTTNSNWVLGEEGSSSADSMYGKVINYEPSFGGNSYKAVTESDDPDAQAEDSSYVRKDAGNYYYYQDYSKIFQFDNPVRQDWIFLKDNVAVNSSWQTPTINGTIGGAAISGYIKMTLLAKGVAETMGKFKFDDVAKVKYEIFMTGVPIPIQTAEKWFAKNVGLVKSSLSAAGTSTTITYIIGDYRIF